jgi:DNA primase
MADLKKELNVLDETLDLAKDLVGARKKLKHHYLQKNESVFLAQVSEKPLSLLTDDERTLLKTLGSNSKHITKE